MRILFFFAAFIATIFGANWSIEHFGFVTVAPGYTAPAGVFAAGLAFTLRDLLHEQRNGPLWVLLAIVIGALCSYVVAPTFAMASAVAFLLSESADFAVYSPLRRRGWLLAVAASNIAGLVIDSLLFLYLAFGSIEYIEGQVLGKSYMTVAAALLLWFFRTRSRAAA